MTQRQKLLDALTEADIKASEAGIGVSPMSRVRLEYIVDRLLEAGVLLPPCKVGDTVYYLCIDESYREADIAEITVTEVGGSRFWSDEGRGDYSLGDETDYSDFGEICFLNKEDAERAAKNLRKKWGIL